MQQSSQGELTDGVTSMETSDEHSSGRDESDVGTKKRRKSDVSANGNTVMDSSENQSSVENAVPRHFQGATAGTANASIAESVIEPTLVMLEVKILQVQHNYFCTVVDFLDILL